jgi:uncharacterized cupin superfamily protein
MPFTQLKVKGLSKCLIADGLDPDRLSLHLSELEPGASAHPPHAHQGTEAFCVLEGDGAIDIEGERHSLGPNEAMVLDATRAHGLTNTGSTRLRYVVINTR